MKKIIIAALLVGAAVSTATAKERPDQYYVDRVIDAQKEIDRTLRLYTKYTKDYFDRNCANYSSMSQQLACGDKGNKRAEEESGFNEALNNRIQACSDLADKFRNKKFNGYNDEKQKACDVCDHDDRKHPICK